MNQNKNRVNYRFPLWLTVIFLLLILVPCAILSNYIVIAKISGVLCLLVVIVALRFWFRAAKLNSNVKDRVIINKNDWFDLERFYPSLYKWNKNDVSILKDRIGLLLANVEIRNQANELCSRKEAIEIAFQFCVYQWEDVAIQLDHKCIAINKDLTFIVKDVKSDEVILGLTLGSNHSYDTLIGLKSHYRSINETD